MIISEKQARLLRELDVVLVDDNKTLISVVSKLLNTLCISSLRSATDGATALQMLQEQPANLVITDLNMRPMNGFVFTRNIRSGQGGIDPRMPVVAMTSNADTEAVKAALLAGVNGFMVKPIEPQAMVARIEKVINTRVVYQLKGSVYVANPRADGEEDDDLVYDGLLPRVAPRLTKTVESPGDSSQEDDAWVLD